MDRIFKIRCSAIGQIMGDMGLTDIQVATLAEYEQRKKGVGKPLTANMEAEYSRLCIKRDTPELPTTAKTYLHEWYANDNEVIHSKYTDKGNVVESELIDFMAQQLGYGLAEKNMVSMEDEYFTGTCDVDLPNCVVDVKAPWNKKTLHEACFGINQDYKYQLKGYCHLYNKPIGMLFYGLMDTPEDINYGNEISYSEMPANERWVAYEVKADPVFIAEVIKRVQLCRIYLDRYDAMVKAKLGYLITN